MFVIIQIVHVLVSLTLILFILLQTGKGSDLGAMLGGGGSNTLFGATGATSFLAKLTRYAAVVFMLTCLGLAYISAHPATAMDRGDTSVMPDAPAAADVPDGAPADSDDAAVPDDNKAEGTDAAAPSDAEAAPEADKADAPGPAKEGGEEKKAADAKPKTE